jgi:hypothetical protein
MGWNRSSGDQKKKYMQNFETEVLSREDADDRLLGASIM